MRRYIPIFGLFFLFSLIILSFSTELHSADQIRCKKGQAYSAIDGKCIACTQPCKTTYLGQCRHGIMNCAKKPGECEPVVLPGERSERCDGFDNDCDGQIDEGFDKDEDGYTTCSGDCNDRNPDIFPDSLEKCDGLDNDCDGQIDEPFKVGRTCFLGVGNCKNKGIWVCRDDKTDSFCDATEGKPTEEICDGFDNDCDGDIDEELGSMTCGIGVCKVTVRVCQNGNEIKCVPKRAGKELCGDQIDNDCDGLVDEGFEKLNSKCNVGVGACKREGRFLCSESKLELICDATPGIPQDEICGNGIDEDCDGKIDNAKNLGKPCDNELLGECLRHGEMICNKFTGKLQCSVGKIEAGLEICDGLDNDCDGRIDEDLKEERECGTGACAGGIQSRDCIGGKFTNWSECTTAKRVGKEVCDGVDNDCDGSIDEDVVEIRDCGVGICEGGVEERHCKMGVWGEWLECSSNSLAHPEICDLKDNDCDGEVDEGVLNVCGGCDELAAAPGDSCMMPGSDECGVGEYACSESNKGQLECKKCFDLSEGNLCSRDENECTDDICKDGRCQHIPVSNGKKCDDENLCTDEDMCMDGACVGGARHYCGDENPCTVDSCEPDRGCSYSVIGDGRPNECGGCKILEASAGDDCLIEGMRGPCIRGKYECTIDREMVCVQTNFPSEEFCNGIDDDCDGAIDEDLGKIECGEGTCKVVLDKCRDGSLEVCVPLDAGLEDCTNMGTDDDCNGIIDDIPDLGKGCEINVGLCSIAGYQKCGNGNMPECFPLNESDLVDDDRDGIPNICDSAGLEKQTSEENRMKIFDQKRTRAFMMPWRRLTGVLALKNENKREVLLLSGTDGKKMGITYLDRSHKGDLLPCWIDGSAGSGEIIKVDKWTVFSDLKNIYYAKDILDKIDKEKSEKGNCSLDFEKIPLKDSGCEIEKVLAVESVTNDTSSFVAAVLCSKQKDKKPVSEIKLFLFKFDDMKDAPEMVEIGNFVALDFLKYVRVISEKEGEAWFVLLAESSDDKQVIVTCQSGDTSFACKEHSLNIPGHFVHLSYPLKNELQSKAFALTDKGKAFWMHLDDQGNIQITGAGGISSDDSYGNTIDATFISLSKKNIEDLILARENLLSHAFLAKNKNEVYVLSSDSENYYLPVSEIDSIVSEGDRILVRPHLLLPFGGSLFGGPGLFAAYDINVAGEHLGSMGFIYDRFNLPPEGGIKDIDFDGLKGTVKIGFTDPSNDDLSVSVNVTANHGGDLDSWIDLVEKDKFIFSIKGDYATAGLWPIRVQVTAEDPGGYAVQSVALLNSDGSIESIRKTVIKNRR